MSKLTGKELANELTHFVNGWNETKEEEFIESFCREHRTLQQSGVRLLLRLLAKVGSEEYGTDARNEQAHNVAKKMLKGFKKEMETEYISQGTSPERVKEYLSGEYSLPHRYLGTI